MPSCLGLLLAAVLQLGEEGLWRAKYVCLN